MGTIVEQDVLYKLRSGDIVVTKNEEIVKLLEYLGDGMWAVKLEYEPYSTGILFIENVDHVRWKK